MYSILHIFLLAHFQLAFWRLRLHALRRPLALRANSLRTLRSPSPPSSPLWSETTHSFPPPFLLALLPFVCLFLVLVFICRIKHLAWLGPWSLEHTPLFCVPRPRPCILRCPSGGSLTHAPCWGPLVARYFTLSAMTCRHRCLGRVPRVDSTIF